MLDNDHKNEDSASRKFSLERGMSGLSKFFVSDVVRAQILGWMIKALSNKRLVQKIDGGHSAVILEHAWIFQFIDIIYVGTIFKLSHLIGLCGKGADVYIICCAYFAIMFSTRLSFDVYTCISGANGVLHVIAFCFYGIGVYIMTVNISSHIKSLQPHSLDNHISAYSSSSLIGTNITYGTCERSIDYDTAFAIAFIFTRFILIIMYGLYFYVFHESNQIGHAPEVGIYAKGLRLSDLTRDSDSEVVKEFRASISSGIDHDSRDFNNLNQINNNTNINTGSSNKQTKTNHNNHNHHHTTINNPILHNTELLNRSSFVLNVTNKYTENKIKIYFTRIFLLKVIPVILSSLFMCLIFFKISPLLVLPIVAFIEFIGDFLPSWFINDSTDWKELNPSRHFLEERLGLFFMLVLGEVVVGFSAINYESDSMEEVYKVLIFSFFTIFAVGLQYFEPLQSYTKPEGPHPLDIQELNPVYIWVVCTASFFMLIAGNGMVELYGQVAGSEYLAMSSDHLQYQKQKVANGLGSITILIIIMKILDKVYYRERLLPSSLFNWLNQFYQKYENEEEKEKLKNIQKNTLKREESEDSDYDVTVLTLATTNSNNIQNNKYNNKRKEKIDDINSNKRKNDNIRSNSTESNNNDTTNNNNNPILINSISTSSKQIILHDTDYMNSRTSLHIISKSHLAMGIRRIRPLTVLRMIISGIQYILWTVDSIATSDYMTYFALLIVFPSIVEVILEVRNFIRKEYGGNSGSGNSSDGSNIEDDSCSDKIKGSDNCDSGNNLEM